MIPIEGYLQRALEEMRDDEDKPMVQALFDAAKDYNAAKAASRPTDGIVRRVRGRKERATSPELAEQLNAVGGALDDDIPINDILSYNPNEDLRLGPWVAAGDSLPPNLRTAVHKVIRNTTWKLKIKTIGELRDFKKEQLRQKGMQPDDEAFAFTQGCFVRPKPPTVPR